MLDAEVRADPLYSQLAARSSQSGGEGRAVFVDFTSEPGSALRPQTVLSLPVLLDWLVP